jgi:hypothetical protein
MQSTGSVRFCSGSPDQSAFRGLRLSRSGSFESSFICHAPILKIPLHGYCFSPDYLAWWFQTNLNQSLQEQCGKQRAKSVPPKSNRLMADVDATLVQQIFHISKRKWKTHIHHHRQADDFRRRLEVLEWVAFCYPETLIAHPARLNRFCSDSAPFVLSHVFKTAQAELGSWHSRASLWLI